MLKYLERFSDISDSILLPFLYIKYFKGEKKMLNINLCEQHNYSEPGFDRALSVKTFFSIPLKGSTILPIFNKNAYRLNNKLAI